MPWRSGAFAAGGGCWNSALACPECVQPPKLAKGLNSNAAIGKCIQFSLDMARAWLQAKCHFWIGVMDLVDILTKDNILPGMTPPLGGDLDELINNLVATGQKPRPNTGADASWPWCGQARAVP